MWCKNPRCISLNTLSLKIYLRLGAYMAVPVKINYFLSENIFNDVLEERILFKKLEQQYNLEVEEKVIIFFKNNFRKESITNKESNSSEEVKIMRTFKILTINSERKLN